MRIAISVVVGRTIDTRCLGRWFGQTTKECRIQFNNRSCLESIDNSLFCLHFWFQHTEASLGAILCIVERFPCTILWVNRLAFALEVFHRIGRIMWAIELHISCLVVEEEIDNTHIGCRIATGDDGSTLAIEERVLSAAIVGTGAE